MGLVASTCLHYAGAVLVFCPQDPLRVAYALVIASGTTLSAAWHCADQPRNWLMRADYALAAIWFVFDILLSILRGCPAVLVAAVFLNATVFFTWYCTHKNSTHTLWHLLSVAKTVLLAYLVGCYANDVCQNATF